MSRVTVFLLFCLMCQSQRAFAFLPGFLQERIYGQHQAGIDLSQLNYLVTTKKQGFNAGLFYQYQPFRFLSLNASVFSNHVFTKRRQGYRELVAYESRGTCFKLGFDVSLRLNRNKSTRVFWGYQKGLIHGRESGRFFAGNQYWGDHNFEYATKARNYLVTEWIFGFQFGNRNLVFRPQFYGMFAKDDDRISKRHDIVENYHSPFIPGYGFIRGGINFLLLYRLN